MATIKDIAREANVSISTVSFAINGTRPVAPETKRRIMEAIERLNYHPSSAARGLVTSVTKNICLHVPHPRSEISTFDSNNLINHLLQGVSEVIDEKNYNLLLAWEKDHDETNHKVLSLVRSRAIDGILFSNPTRNFKPIYELLHLEFPFVFMGRFYEDQPVNMVDIDNFDAGCRNTAHLIKLGHQKISFISPGPLEYLLSEDRFEGYRQALKDHHIPFSDSYLHIGDLRRESGYQAMSNFMQLKEPPTAVVAGRDLQAVGVLDYAKEHGLSIPNDMALVSFENSPLSDLYDISSINTDLYMIGREAAKLLMNLIGRKRKQQAQNIVIPSELIIRGSCGGDRSTSSS